MQIVSYGAQDLTLTGNPEITFFKIVYRRYTNFGKKINELSFDNSPSFNSTLYANFPKNNGDLISKIILKIKLPEINFEGINSLLTNNDSSTINEIYNEGVEYYLYFLSFKNKLQNIVKNFFIRYNLSINNSSIYVQGLKNFILKYINTDEFYQFYIAIDFFFNKISITTNIVKYNIDLYTNASLFKIVNNNLIYVYEEYNSQNISYDEFKYLIENNMEILNGLNIVMYDILKKNANQEKKIKFSWVNKIAIYILNSVDFYIGSNKIYTLSDTYINNYGELYYKNKELYNELIGNNISINNYSPKIDETTLYLPIPLWGLSNYGLSFPLISLQYNSIQIRINTKKFLECIRIDYEKSENSLNINNDIVNYILNNFNNISIGLDMTMLIEYIYLDSVERNKFAKSAHEYLIEQVQEIEFSQISLTNNTFQLDLFHCCKDMFWFVQKIPTLNDIFSKNNDVFEYIYLRPDITIPTNLQIFINYTKMINNNFTLFNPYLFYEGLYIINNNLKFSETAEIIINYISNSNLFPSFNNNLNVIILESYFNLNGVQLIGENFSFFNYVQIYNYYNATPQLGLNVYSFSLKPTEFQPAGACNMSRISFIGLKLKIRSILPDELENIFIKNANDNSLNEYKLIFQTRNYNILRLIGGIGATAYTY